MQFQITEIEFDFDDDIGNGDTMDNFLTDEYKRDLYEDYIGTFWEADDADDLVDEVTSASGWCIKSIDYRIILS